MRRRNNSWKRPDSLLRWYCRKLTAKQRVVFIATAFGLFMASCLYIILSSLSAFGEPGRGLKMEHIRPLDMKPEKDTTIHFKDYYDYGYSENQDTVRFIS